MIHPATARRIAAALLLLAALPAQSIRIGTWNLELLGCRTPPRTEADVQAIADQVRKLDVAVLAVQEICSDEALADLCRRLGASWQFVLGTSGGWTDGKTRQSIGFLYDTASVRLLHAAELLDLPRELDDLPIFHRVPVTACFATADQQLDFRAVTVHFKAGQKPDDERKRRLEATQLRDWLARLLGDAGEDQDVVVLGDFNHGPGSAPQQAFERQGTVRYLSSPKPVDPTIAHFDTPIDVVAVTRGFAEVRAATLDVHNEQGLADKARWRAVYTDHFPVTVEVDARADGDPRASFRQEPAPHALPAAQRPAAPPAAPPPAPPTGADAAPPLPPGTRVVVRARDAMAVTGTLLRPLGDWVYVRDDGGLVHAFPVQNVIVVQQQAPR